MYEAVDDFFMDPDRADMDVLHFNELYPSIPKVEDLQDESLFSRTKIKGAPVESEPWSPATPETGWSPRGLSRAGGKTGVSEVDERPKDEVHMQKQGNKSYEQRSDIHFNIVDAIGILSTATSGWTREVNIVSWNGSEARIDIRDWSPNHQRCSKGVRLNQEETKNLVKLLSAYDLDAAGI